MPTPVTHRVHEFRSMARSLGPSCPLACSEEPGGENGTAVHWLWRFRTSSRGFPRCAYLAVASTSLKATLFRTRGARSISSHAAKADTREHSSLVRATRERRIQGASLPQGRDSVCTWRCTIDVIAITRGQAENARSPVRGAEHTMVG